jgi:hypothetical protein
MCWDDDLDREQEPEPQELPSFLLDESGPCRICGRPKQHHACFHCGSPVCMDESNYMNDTVCGSWILDWWHNSAFDPDDGNEFWCKECVKANSLP